jgi:hypothetical protein
MSGRSIESLPTPPRGFRVDLGNNASISGFETLNDSQREDVLRAKWLANVVRRYPHDVSARSAEDLASRLDAASQGKEVPGTLASSSHMRAQRIKIAGHLWLLVTRSAKADVCSFTIIPRNWQFKAYELQAVDPRQLLNCLTVAIYGRGATAADGWIYAYLHGEWDPSSRVYRLHVHGFAYGPMIGVIDRLRNLPNYQTQRYLKDGSPSPVYRRVRMTRKRLTNLPFPITYSLQAYWPARALIILDDGARIRARLKQRLPEPQHSQVLLWLDRWRISDLTMMIGLRVTKAGLIQTKPVS